MVPEREPATGKYMYCIIRCPEPRQFGTRGMGERGDVVHTVHFEDLAAVVSDSPVVEYESDRRNLMAHTLVLEEVLKQWDLLPVRFGTVAPDTETIQERLLKRRFGELHELLRGMTGRVELGLKAFWYEQAIFEEIVAEDPAIRKIRDALAGRGPEESYYERLQLGGLVEQAMWRKRAEDAERIRAPLRDLAVEIRDKKVITDRMVLSAAFLVDRDRQPAFDAAVQKLDAEMGQRLLFRYVGPVPPYNFVSIVVSWKD
jgi:gas vesicle protein GvpL/GvpF